MKLALLRNPHRSILFGLLLTLVVSLYSTRAAVHTDYIYAFRDMLGSKILPYWYDTTIDAVHGGYLVGDDGTRLVPAQNRQLDTYCQLIATFSMAHRAGLSTAERNYLDAAANGYRYLVGHFLDPVHGGFYWSADLGGKVTDENKYLYGQASAILALVEYHRAGGGEEPLRQALELFFTLEAQARDARHDGWTEHFTKSWRPMLVESTKVPVGAAGLKSAQAHLRMMEALAELTAASQDPIARMALRATLEVNRHRFFPEDPASARQHARRDWQSVTPAIVRGLSFGMNLEFATRMIRAERVLLTPPSWRQFYTYLNETVHLGFDGKNGGLFATGDGAKPAVDKSKVFVGQAELLGALAEAYEFQRGMHFERILTLHIKFLYDHFIDPKDGVFRTSLGEDGTFKDPAKASNMKAAEREIRALLRIIEAMRLKPVEAS